MNQENINLKAENFDNFMRDFHAYVAPHARSLGWFNHYSEVNFVPKHLSDNSDYHGHNPIQVTICLALQCKDWAEVCKKFGKLNFQIFGKESNL